MESKRKRCIACKYYNVLYFTLMPIITSLPFIFNHPYTSMNLDPFIDVLNGRGDFMRHRIKCCSDNFFWIFIAFGKKAKC